MPLPPTRDFRLGVSLVARLLGVALLLLALLVFAVTVVVVVADLSPWWLVGFAVLGLLAATGLAWATRRVSVLSLDEAGYRIRLVRRAGVTAAGWPEVRDVTATTSGGAPVVVLSLADGRTSRVPVGVLDADKDTVVRAIAERLPGGDGRGERPL